MGNTKVMCVLTGPAEQQQQQQQQRKAQATGSGSQRDAAAISVSVVVAGFSSVDRKKRGRNDKLVLSQPV
jgi:exosome complex component RRP41